MRLRLVVTALLAGVVLSACSGSPSDAPLATSLLSTLRVGIVPNIAPEKQRATYAPFGEALGTALSPGSTVDLGRSAGGDRRW
jgi:phosphonate transport system substrate-binding protein